MKVGSVITLGILCAILITLPRAAHAYIDTGSGSYMLQMILAGFLALSAQLQT